METNFVVTGTIFYNAIETGYWGIEEQSGKRWRLVSPPPKIEHQNLKITIHARHADEDMSIFMTDDPIEVISFEIIN